MPYKTIFFWLIKTLFFCKMILVSFFQLLYLNKMLFLVNICDYGFYINTINIFRVKIKYDMHSICLLFNDKSSQRVGRVCHTNE